MTPEQSMQIILPSARDKALSRAGHAPTKYFAWCNFLSRFDIIWLVSD